MDNLLWQYLITGSNIVGCATHHFVLMHEMQRNEATASPAQIMQEH